MLREDMVECAALVGKALVLCQYGHGKDAAEPLAEALSLLQKAPDAQRQKWRERKQAQRASMSPDVTGTSLDVTGKGCDVTGDSVVEEVEEVVVEEVVPPVFVSMDDVDAVLTSWNALTGSSMRTGPTRSKRSAEQLRSLLVRLAKEEGDDVAAARSKVGEVVKWLWADRAGTDLAKYVVPSTVCRKWDAYAEQITVPDNGSTSSAWNPRA